MTDSTDAGFGKIEFYVLSGFEVTVDGGDDRAYLLVTGGHQECWRAAVAFRTGNVEVRIRLAKFFFSMGADGTTAVDVGIDEIGYGGCTLQRGVNAQTHLTEKTEVGTGARVADDFVNAGQGQC